MTCGPLCNGGSATQTVIHYQARPHMVVTTQPHGPAFYNVPSGQPQIAYPAQQGQYPQAQAPPPAYPAQQVQYPQAQAPPTANPAQHVQYPQTQAPPTGEQQYQELIK
ncbi:endo-1,4-beta-xylanase C-like isoform X1 [Patiria miniata]|nr:endo-1,4-beta-xylanase C-like isoform X1 [Patiria miniata]XP_038059833.1 endo-1,4-beta-xylanase C-like [Patiria miniata]XP_038075162.1 endo-1,4-beta-xylanase C-like isoform X1 [Patiria miniata]